MEPPLQGIPGLKSAQRTDNSPADAQYPNRWELDMWLLLPDELWLIIITMLDQRDIPRVALVCSRFAMLCSLHFRPSVVINKWQHLTESVLTSVSYHHPRRLVLSKRLQNPAPQPLDYLSILETLDGLHVDWQIDDASLKALTKATQLCALNLQDCRLVSDTGLSHLISASTLKELKLNHCTNFTEFGFASSVTALQHLLSLSISDCPLLSHAGVASLVTLSRLTVLQLNSTYILDCSISQLCNLHALSVLHLNECFNLTDGGLASLSPLSRLKTLELRVCNGIVSGMSSICSGASRGTLRTLVLNQCQNVSDDGLSRLSSCSALTFLDLGGCDNVTNASLSHLSDLTGLKSLNLSRCCNIAGTGPNLCHLSALSALRHLDLHSCFNIDPDLLHLSGLSGLRTLNLSNTDVGGDHLVKMIPSLVVTTDDAISDEAELDLDELEREWEEEGNVSCAIC